MVLVVTCVVSAAVEMAFLEDSQRAPQNPARRQSRIVQKQLQHCTALHCTAQLQLCETLQLRSWNGPRVSKLSRCADAAGHEC